MYMYMYVWNFNSHVYKNFMSSFLWTLLQFKLSRNYIWSVQSEPQKIWVLFMIFFHSKFKTAGYKFEIKKKTIL